MFKDLKNWQYFDAVADNSIFFCVVIAGTYALYLHNNVLPIVFILMALIVSFNYKNLIFKAVLALFPVIFLLYYMEWAWAAVFILFITVWFILHKNIYDEKGGNVNGKGLL